MILKKDNWNNNDKLDFNNYLFSLKNEEKVLWTKNIVNTNMNVLAIKNDNIKEIVKEISKGNYLSFLDLNINTYYECTIINAGLICKIKDFDLQKKYLDNYIKTIDNWASVDTLKFKIKNKEKEYLDLSKEYIKSDKEFIRRVGVIILFEFIKRKEYLNEVFNIIKSLYNEDAYYVNMAISWLLCESFIKNRDETLEFIKNNKLNKFVINKTISKCNDSFRISKEDKELLKQFKE